MIKQNRTLEEKIDDALDNNIRNLHPTRREQFRQILLNMTKLANNVAQSATYIKKTYNFPENGKNTKRYWIARGWSDSEAHSKCDELFKTKYKDIHSLTPWGREFWITKINPRTGVNYTEEEADFERNSRRPIRKEYWMVRGYNEGDAVALSLQTKHQNNTNGKQAPMDIQKSVSKRCKEYWMIRGCSESEATEAVAKQQSTFSLEKCIANLGADAGTSRWLERQKLWQTNFKKTNFSKVSQRLFWEIASHLDNLEHIYFAELSEDKIKDESGINHELRMTLDRGLMPDFIDVRRKKIIEFDGTYWHGEIGHGNRRRDEERDADCVKHGYQIMHVNESEYANNPKHVVGQCLNFLTS